MTPLNLQKARLGALVANQTFTTLISGRRGSVLEACEYGDAVNVAFSDGERKALHKNVLVGIHWVN